jgi:membrane associated rhomboid family serine protease
LDAGTRRAPAFLTPLTSAFLHANIVHLFGNMLFLWVFGRHVEDSFGRAMFLILVVVLAYVSSGVEIALHPHSQTHFLGASGFISGIMGAYLAVFPKAKLRFGSFYGLTHEWIEYRWPAWAWLGLGYGSPNRSISS